MLVESLQELSPRLEDDKKPLKKVKLSGMTSNKKILSCQHDSHLLRYLHVLFQLISG